MLVATDMSQQQFTAFGALFVCLIHNRTKLWGDKSSRVTIGEAYDCNIIGYAQTTRFDCIEGGIGDDIVESKNGIRTFLALKQLQSSLPCLVKINFPTQHQIAVYGQTMVAQGLKITVLAPQGGLARQ